MADTARDLVSEGRCTPNWWLGILHTTCYEKTQEANR